jgi:Ca2+-binding RTX toxin-like protein
MASEHMALLDLVDRSDATHVAIAHGDWFDPATWHEGRIPGPDAQVVIPHGIHVTYDGQSDASLFTVRVDGNLSFATDVDTRMVVDTFVVSPSGRLEIGTAERPIAADVDAELVIANNGDIDVAWDPMLLSRGVISHGSVEIHGAEKTTFLRVDTAPMAGDTEIVLSEAPAGWQVGDTIVLTGTHKQGWMWDNDLRAVVYRESEDEEVVITAIDGNRITIDRPLAHDHDTPRDDLAAYVSNMSRNITVRSEDGEDSAVHHRGHVMFMHSDDVDVRYAAFDDLGRTDKSEPAADVGTFDTITADANVKGRYSLHLHRTGTEDQDDPTYVVGNAVSGSPGWGFVQHSSHSVFVDNAAFDVFGAAFAAEDGDETGVWARNIAIRSEGIGHGDSTAKLESDVLRHDNGRTGDGFFFAGRLVESVENVAANTTHGFVWMHRSAPSDPLSANLEHPEIAYGAELMPRNEAPIQGFHNNEAFGTHVGMIVVKAGPRQEHEVRTVMDGFLNWETTAGVSLSYTSHYTLLNMDLLGTDNPAPVAAAYYGVQLGNNSYDMVFNGAEIAGFSTGIDVSTNGYTFPISTEDAQSFFIDVEMSDTGRDYLGRDASRHQILTSQDLVEGRLEFEMTGDLTISPGETLFFDGIKTDSIGSRDRQFTSADDIQNASFHDNIVPLLQSQGYYTTDDGRYVLLVEDFIADRATGELLKFSHVVTLDMTQAQLASYGAVDNGPVTLGGAAPVGVADTATVAPGSAVVIDVLANDSDPEGGPIRVDGMTQPGQGGVVMGPNGTILYIAGIDTEGTDTFTYWVADNAGNFTQTDVSVTIDADLEPTPGPVAPPDPDPVPDPDPDPLPDPDPQPNPDPQPDPAPDPGPGPGAGVATSGFSAEYFVLSGDTSTLDEVDWTAAPAATGTASSLDYGGGAFWNGGPDDFFAARFTGDLHIGTAGNYTFFLTSDDGSMLSINGETVVDNDGLQAAFERSATVYLEAGSHDIDVRFFENQGDEVLELDWAGPDTGGARTLLTDADVTHGSEIVAPPRPEPGLQARYYALDAPLSSVEDVDWSAPADATDVVDMLDYGGTERFWETGSDDYFAAQYSGFVQIETAGDYTFFLTSDDGAVLSLEGTRIIDNDGLHAAQEEQTTLFLEAGEHEIDLRYFENAGLQVLELDWSGPDTDGNRERLTEDAVTTGSLYGGGSGIGSAGDDVFAASDAGIAFDGQAGSDSLFGGAGADTLIGGSESDLLIGSGGSDVILGQSGRDMLLGESGFDSLHGGRGDDVLDGGVGDDRLDGGRDSDVLFGGRGRDLLLGGSGDDTLDGGNGRDTLTGGNGADHFVFMTRADGGGGTNTVTDFQIGVDLIDLRDYGTEFASLDISSKSGGTRIALDDGPVIHLDNVDVASLNASAFLL